MKAVNLVVGFFVFSIVVSMFFAATYDILNYEGVDGADDFNALSGEYEGLGDEFGDQSGTPRQIQDQTKQGVAQTDEPDVAAYKGAFSGIKLAANFLVNFEDIVHNATGDVNTGGEGYIDDRIISAIIVVLSIFIIFVILHFIRGFKAET